MHNLHPCLERLVREDGKFSFLSTILRDKSASNNGEMSHCILQACVQKETFTKRIVADEKPCCRI